MNIKIVNRRYNVNPYWIAIRKLIRPGWIGLKFCIGKYEIRFYKLFKVKNYE